MNLNIFRCGLLPVLFDLLSKSDSPLVISSALDLILKLLFRQSALHLLDHSLLSRYLNVFFFSCRVCRTQIYTLLSLSPFFFLFERSCFRGYSTLYLVSFVVSFRSLLEYSLDIPRSFDSNSVFILALRILLHLDKFGVFALICDLRLFFLRTVYIFLMKAFVRR